MMVFFMIHSDRFQRQMVTVYNDAQFTMTDEYTVQLYEYSLY